MAHEHTIPTSIDAINEEYSKKFFSGNFCYLLQGFWTSGSKSCAEKKGEFFRSDQWLTAILFFLFTDANSLRLARLHSIKYHFFAAGICQSLFMPPCPSTFCSRPHYNHCTELRERERPEPGVPKIQGGSEWKTLQMCNCVFTLSAYLTQGQMRIVYISLITTPCVCIYL